MRELRRFELWRGNPLAKVATVEAYSKEEAWDSVREEGYLAGYEAANVRLREVLTNAPNDRMGLKWREE